jgi:hypothetical protein
MDAPTNGPKTPDPMSRRQFLRVLASAGALSHKRPGDG